MSLNSLQNFCRVLQILPKHFKFSQYKSLPATEYYSLESSAIQICSGTWWKTLSNAAEYYSLETSAIQSLLGVYAKSIAQNPIEPL
jgi:hypothetical protein